MPVDPFVLPDEVAALPARLGIEGFFDVHTHFMAPPVMAKVRQYFDDAGPLLGRPWPLTYRGDETELVSQLGALGVRRFSALSYAHKPGMAEFLNDWADAFADRVPAVLRCGTFFPEPEATAYVGKRLAGGVELFKVHVQVGAFWVTDPLLDESWGQIAEAGVPVVLHAGSGPVPNEFTGPAPVAELLRRHPGLRLLFAHAGAPEYEEFLGLAERYPGVGLDTTMVFTSFFDEMDSPFPDRLLGRLAALGDKVFLGSDFPNIPYPWWHQVEVLVALREREPLLDDAWLAGVLWHNAERLFESRSAGSAP
ncbi:amidohydrolase family protein [Nocardioides limicola]|uniref:amidohydrolase family protein n=1 Tax=Nocardioides limicola TaxID=2803368 RepID=UPI0027DDDAD6|nr:amidohydrolase family protein [Nocardioides sp. DJM-14]